MPLAPEYIVPPLTNSPSTLVDDFLAYLEANLPGWQGSAGNLDVLIGEAFSFPAAETADLASGVLTSVFRYFGSLVGVNVIDGTPASASASYTLVDDSGYTITAGTTVGLRDANGDLWTFILPDDLIVAPGNVSGSATVYAESVGTAANGLSGEAELVDVPGAVIDAVIAAPSANGTDAEDDPTYLNRLRETLTLLTPEPILPDDFAVLARSVPGVFRATAVDGLKPGPPYTGTAESTGNERIVTVAVAGADGLAVDPAVRTAAAAYLVSLREQSFLVYVVDPQYATIDVATTVKVWEGNDPTIVQASVIETLTSLLSPVLWGTGDRGNLAAWINDPVIRQSRLFQAISNTPGVQYVTALAFGPHGGSQGLVDVTMGAGSAIPALPLAGTIAVTATP